MAHYACDCWDAEVETSYGWIEVAGHADRSAFDLTKHSEKTGVELKAPRKLKEDKKINVVIVTLDKKKLGTTFRKESKPILDTVEKWSEEEKEAYFKEWSEKNEIALDINGQNIVLSSEYIQMKVKEQIIKEEKYVPHVIEPSFGIGRIIYCIFEHCFRIRE